MQVFLSGHDHTCHPEEDDIGASDQHGCGVVVLDLFVVGCGDTLEEGDGP